VGLIADLEPGPVAVDTAAFIYYIEEHSRYLEVVAPLFELVASGKRAIVSSALTLLEVLVVPYRDADLALAERYEALLTRSRGLTLVDIDRAQLRAAAKLRSAFTVRTPDALQMAAALSTGCRTLVTNDRKLPELTGLTVLQLRDYVG
jgi:predicted nucleic acid-binding protein